jgi:molecular chaperone GrpE (heat shock protein)
VDVTEGEKENLVVEVLRKGYKMGEEVLRIAQVRVSVRKREEEAVEKAKE